MRVCFLTERMKLGFGVDLVVDEQARRLAAHGFDVTVVVIDAETGLQPRPYRLIVLRRLMPLGDFSSPTWAKHVLKTLGITADLWIAETPPFYEWGTFLDGPVIHVEHGCPEGSMFDPETGAHLDQMTRHRLTDTYARLIPCDAISSISKSIHDWLPKPVQAFSTIVHNGCDHYPRAPHEQAQALRRSLGLADDEVMLLWVGRMQFEGDEQPYKRFSELLTLIPLIEQHLPQARIVLAGRVSDRDKSRLTNRGLTVLSNLTAEELATAYAAADVLLNLSRWEGFNLALLEAQFQGTPVVAYDVGPHSEIVRHGETGLLAKDPKDFFDAVVKITTDAALREKLAAQTEAFAAGFSWKASLDKFEAVVAACLEKNPGREKVLAQRAEAAARLAAKGEPDVDAPPPSTVADLLACEGRDFVRAARDLVLGEGTDTAAEDYWLWALRRGAGKHGVLLEMADVARIRGPHRDVPGLSSALAFTRLRRWLRSHLLGRDFTGRRGPSAWLEMKDQLLVEHAYRLLLGREAEPEAVVGRVAQLQGGFPREQMLGEIRFSDEGRARPLEEPELTRLILPRIIAHAPSSPLPARDSLDNGAPWQNRLARLARFGRPLSSSRWFKMDDAEFVRQAYLTLLHREAEPAAITGWSAELSKGMPRRTVLAEIRYSDEGRNWPLRDRELRLILQPEIIRRRPLKPASPLGGRLHAALELGGNLLRLLQPLPAHFWFTLDNEAFIRHAYWALIGREPEPHALAEWSAALRSGYSRAGVLTDIRESAEGRRRVVNDPDLRAIIFNERARRTPPLSILFGRSSRGDGEPETLRREVRRIDTIQQDLSAEMRHLRAVAESAAQPDHRLDGILAKLDALDARLAAAPAAQPAAATVPQEAALFMPSGAAPQLGPHHVALVAPGAALRADALQRLAEAAISTGSDIVFGDELEILDASPRRRQRIHGPFSHEAFLRDPDLGGVIAVRKDLLAAVDLPTTIALTGPVLVKLVGLAHTLTHLSVDLSERTREGILSYTPTLSDMQAYVDRLGRRALVTEITDGRFDVRFHPPSAWMAEVVVFARGDADALEADLVALNASLDARRAHVTLVHVGDAPKRSARRAREREGVTELRFAAGMTYGAMVNKVVRQVPDDRTLILLIDSDVTPLSAGWLDGLAASALRPDIGAVAPRVVYSDGRIRDAGLAMGLGEPCGYVGRFLHSEGPQAQLQEIDLDRLNGLRGVSFVSSSCMAFRRAAFEDHGGFDETLGREAADLDFCCRLRVAGLSILVDGRVTMVQPDPLPQWNRALPEDELKELTTRHGRLLSAGEPFWAPVRDAACAAQGGRMRTVFVPPLSER